VKREAGPKLTPVQAALSEAGMTEAAWEACGQAPRMLAAVRGRAGDRKLRLFACAGCRRLLPLGTDPRSRLTVEVAERYADGAAGPREMADALGALPAAGAGADPAADWPAAVVAATAAAVLMPSAAAAAAAVAANGELIGPGAGSPADASAALLREVFGNPFRPMSVDPAWLAWRGGTVVRLAQAAYEGATMPLPYPTAGTALRAPRPRPARGPGQRPRRGRL
jgi:hypothetical protein